jgi:hypothetical protein
MCALTNAPCLFIKKCPEDASVAPKHVANYVLMIIYIYICCVWLNKLLYHIVEHNGMAAIKKNRYSN